MKLSQVVLVHSTDGETKVWSLTQQQLASPKNWLHMQIFRSHSKPVESECWGHPPEISVCFNKPSV